MEAKFTTKITTTTGDSSGYVVNVYNPAEAYSNIPADAITVDSSIANAMVLSMRTDNKLTLEQALAQANVS